MINETNLVNDIFAIPEENVVAFQDKIAKLNKLASKLGTKPVTATFVKEEIRNVVDHVALAAMIERTGCSEIPFDFVPHRKVKYVHFKVEGEAPKFAGWTFVAAIEPTEHGNLIKKVPGMEIAAEWQSKTMVCDHCNTKRKRKAYYVVRHDGGNEKSVGASCIKDFLGHTDPARVGSWFEYIHELRSFEEGAGRGKTYYDLLEVLAVALAAIRRDGFVSKKMINERIERDGENARVGKATSEDVHYYFSKPYTADEREWHAKHVEKYTPSEGDSATAAAVVQWMLALEQKATRSDFENNLLIFAKVGAITSREFGFITAAAFTGSKALNMLRIEKEPKKNRSNEWIGEVGTRQDFGLLTCVNTRHMESAFGEMLLVSFEDAAGNSLKWFASNPRFEIKEGLVYKVKGTVKKHDSYKERNQTLLSRCKLEEVKTETTEETKTEETRA